MEHNQLILKEEEEILWKREDEYSEDTESMSESVCVCEKCSNNRRGIYELSKIEQLTLRKCLHLISEGKTTTSNNPFLLALFSLSDTVVNSFVTLYKYISIINGKDSNLFGPLCSSIKNNGQKDRREIIDGDIFQTAISEFSSEYVTFNEMIETI